ncbi:MAG: FAD-dependent oxidoreductase, partial [Chloroflexota bacterium]
LAAAAGLHTGRGVLVDEWLQTSDPHIYAAGDVAQVYDPAAGGAFLDSLWGPARQQGIVAGHNMAVGDAPALRKAYRRPVPVNVTRLAGLPVTIIGAVGQGADQDLPGIARGDSETWRFPREAVPAQMRFDANRLRVMVGPHSLLGAVVLGDQAPTDALRRLIGEQADITPLREQLLAPGAPVSALLADFAAAWQGERR